MMSNRYLIYKYFLSHFVHSVNMEDIKQVRLDASPLCEASISS